MAIVEEEIVAQQPVAPAAPVAPGILQFLTLKDFEGPVDPDWCPGCGDFGVLKSLKEALLELHIAGHEALVVSGIGCSSNLPGFLRAYGVHSLHGRALPVARDMGPRDYHEIAFRSRVTTTKVEGSAFRNGPQTLVAEGLRAWLAFARRPVVGQNTPPDWPPSERTRVGRRGSRFLCRPVSRARGLAAARGDATGALPPHLTGFPCSPATANTLPSAPRWASRRCR